MARMWPVAIKNELDTFCGFMECSKSTREVVTDGLGECGARAEWFHGFAEIHRPRLKRVSVNCRFWVWEEGGKGRLGLDLLREDGRTRSSWSGLCVRWIVALYR
jgi:hypothetical protein